jgi:Ca-activated chloride channel family protein
MNTTVLLDQEPHAHGNVVRALLKIEGETPQDANRTKLNLSLVLDRSGSMHGAKLAAARAAAALLVQRLAPEDVVSVVAYDDNVRTVARPSHGTQQLSHLIRSIEAGGSTNLSGGWLKGRDYVAQHVAPNTASRVILLTDGLANVGITNRDQLVGLCAGANESGIRTSTIGFGQDYDERLLAGMAEAGGGHMYYIEQADQAAAIFADELEGLLSLAAQNLTLGITPSAHVQTVAVHHSYPRYETENGLRLELGDLYAREPKLVLIEFLVAPTAQDPVDVAQLSLQGTVVGADGSVKQQEIALDITTSFADGPVSHPEVRRELLLLEAASVRTQVLEDQQRGEYRVALNKMRNVSEKLRTYGVDDAQLQEEAADIELLAERMNPENWTVAESKYMYQRSWDSSRALRKKMEHIKRTRTPKPEAPNQ